MNGAHVIRLFESPSWLVVDKPAGWLTVPGRGAENQKCLIKELMSAASIRLWPVHRLDREVSGVILFAKSAEAHRMANGWFEDRQIRKIYEGWTPFNAEKELPTNEILWTMKLARGKKRSFESPHGKESQTRAMVDKVLEVADEKVVVWRLMPLTGRTHQLRVALAQYYSPLIADVLYGAQPDFAKALTWRRLEKCSIGLRAVTLDFSEIPEKQRQGLPDSIVTKGLQP